MLESWRFSGLLDLLSFAGPERRRGLWCFKTGVGRHQHELHGQVSQFLLSQFKCTELEETEEDVRYWRPFRAGNSDVRAPHESTYVAIIKSKSGREKQTKNRIKFLRSVFHSLVFPLKLYSKQKGEGGNQPSLLTVLDLVSLFWFWRKVKKVEKKFK